MLATLYQEYSDSEWWLHLMSNMFIGMSIIMFLAKISTLLEIVMQIILVFGGFRKLRCGNSLSKIYYTSQENNYLSPFIIYLSNSVKRQFKSETITSSSPSACYFPPIIGSRCMTALKPLFVGAVIIIGYIEKKFKLMANCTYHWI